MNDRGDRPRGMRMTSSSTQTPATATVPDAQQLQYAVQCARLTKVFKDFWRRDRVVAVRDVSLNIRRGEVFGLLGPNGSGKSTTIKMLLGLLQPTAGKIAVLGRLPRDVKTKQDIGYLPEESYLYRFLNARETLEYYGRLFRQSAGERTRRIDMLLEMVGLQHAQRRPVGEYSKGMQRKIGLAQALINDPQLLILDEPTTGMDPIGTRQTKRLILDLKRRGKTVLMCSHLLADVEDVCDRVAIMYGGMIHAMGSVDELLTRQDMTTLNVAGLDESLIAEIDQLLTRHGKRLERVSQPRQKLEEFFDEVVSKAAASGAETSGTTGDGRIAAFLVGEEAETQSAEKVIDQLVQPTPPPPPPPAATAAQREQPAEEAAASHPVDEVITGLTDRAPAAPPPPPPPTAQRDAASAPAHEQVDMSVLGDLVETSKPASGTQPVETDESPQADATSAEVAPEPDEVAQQADARASEAVDDTRVGEPGREDTHEEVAETGAGEVDPDEARDEASVEASPSAPAETTESGETGGMWAAAAAEAPDGTEASGALKEGDLASLYERVPEYDGSDEPQGLIEEEKPDEPPADTEEQPPEGREAPDQSFLRALMEADDEDENKGKDASK